MLHVQTLNIADAFPNIDEKRHGGGVESNQLGEMSSPC